MGCGGWDPDLGGLARSVPAALDEGWRSCVVPVTEVRAGRRDLIGAWLGAPTEVCPPTGPTVPRVERRPHQWWSWLGSTSTRAPTPRWRWTRRAGRSGSPGRCERRLPG